MINPSEINGLIVHGKRWWDRANGNMYSAVRVTVWFTTGEEPDFVYSSFEAHEYKQMAEEALSKQGWIEMEKYGNGVSEGLTRWANRNQVPIYYVVSDTTQTDVKRWGIDPRKGKKR